MVTFMGTMWDGQPTLLPLETRTKLPPSSVITSGKGSAVNLPEGRQELQGLQVPLALPVWHTYSSVMLAAAQKYELGSWIQLSLWRHCMNFTRLGSTGLWTKLRQQSMITLFPVKEQNKERNTRADFFTTLSYVYVASGTIFLLLGNN